MVYRLETQQLLPIDLPTAWEFFSDPRNLSRITPPDMRFTILSGAERRMYAGQIIQYFVSPFPWLRLRWVTEISHVVPGSHFVDEQRFGPYALWHHKHFFEEVPGGVLMTDIVDYKLPMGFLGRLLHPIMVKPRVQGIFDYRRQVLNDLFPPQL